MKELTFFFFQREFHLVGTGKCESHQLITTGKEKSKENVVLKCVWMLGWEENQG